MRPTDPRCFKFWPERYEQEHAKRRELRDNSAKQFETRGVGPMDILEEVFGAPVPGSVK